MQTPTRFWVRDKCVGDILIADTHREASLRNKNHAERIGLIEGPCFADDANKFSIAGIATAVKK